MALNPMYNTSEWDRCLGSLESLGEYAGMHDEGVDELPESGAVGYAYNYYASHSQDDFIVRYLVRKSPSAA